MIPEGRITLVMYVPNAASFLRSYTNQMKKHPMPAMIEEDSFAYTGQDSWLLDFDARLSSFRSVSGAQNVIALDYEQELKRAGSVIPSFLHVLGVASHFRPQDWERFFLNRTPSVWKLRRSRLGQLLRRRCQRVWRRLLI